ncbi:MAG: hypothetical protein K8R53_12000 [Bacteroidales bacterium]|nr:hypothetical protein [Bacteroidales bacterium]
MKLLYRLTIVFFLATIISCETDFDITADWEDITVVYGLLDQKSEVQYIKINRGFIGKGNALDMAAVPDSSNYLFKMDVRIEEWEEDGSGLIRTITFDTTTVYNKEEGTFPYPEQIVYKSEPPYIYHLKTTVGDTFWLNQESVYKLIVYNQVNEKEIYSETILVHDFEIIRPIYETEMNFKFDLNNQDIKKEFKWKNATNGTRYEFLLNFIFDEVDINTVDTISRTITITSTIITPSPSQQDIIFKMRNQEFYEACLRHIPYEDPAMEEQVKTRLHGFADVIISVAAQELTNYINVYEPSTSIVQEKPLYTNIDNGIGIFSSRYQKIKTKKVNSENQCYLNSYSWEVHGVQKNLKFFCDR